MDLRSLPDGLDSLQQCEERRKRIEMETGLDFSALAVQDGRLGSANEKNCEQMFGHVPLPVGYAGPLPVTFSSHESSSIHIPLATTEGALVASVNRGCKALRESGGVLTSSEHIGITRSLCLQSSNIDSLRAFVEEKSGQWQVVGMSTSDHLHILEYSIDVKKSHLFLTINCDTDEAMGMNMVTIAAQSIGHWITEQFEGDCRFVTVAGNVDSDKKPSHRTKTLGRGYRVHAKATVTKEALATIKSDAEAVAKVAKAKLELGSAIAEALGNNLHAANTIAALYLATGQDTAHVVEGSLTDTTVRKKDDRIQITVSCPAILVGVRGGGTALPAQQQCLDLLLHAKTELHPCQQVAESIGAAVLAGELSLLAAQASHALAKAHENLGR